MAYLLDGLARAGFEVVLAAPAGSPLAVVARGAGHRVEPFDSRGDVDPGAVWRLTGLARRHGVGLIHAHTAAAHALAVGAGRLAGVSRRVVTRRVALPPRRTPFSAWKYRTGVTRYIAISGVVRAALIAGGVSKGRISVVPSGVPVVDRPAADRPTDRAWARAALGLSATAPVLAVIGALTPEKGQDLALRALARLPDEVRLVLIGDGKERGRLEAIARELGVAERVQWAGFRSDVPALLPAFDLLLAPSRHEGLGTAVLEGLAAGLPIVAAAVGEFPVLLDGGRAGRLVPPEDPVALAEASKELLADDVGRRDLAGGARRRAADYSVERMIAGNIQVYESLIGDCRRVRSANAADAGSSPSGGSLSCQS